jgi:hypothetical protein
MAVAGWGRRLYGPVLLGWPAVSRRSFQRCSRCERFPRMALGPEGLDPVFSAVALEHRLDGHFRYQQPVSLEANRRLQLNPQDQQVRWTLALMAALANRPNEAAEQFAQLQKLIPDTPWPADYRSVVNFAGEIHGRPCPLRTGP